MEIAPQNKGIAVGDYARDGAGISSPADDPLTGLLSQEAFCLSLDRLVAKRDREGQPLTLALLQLANFYEIRRWVGGAEANMLLNDVARQLESAVPKNSLLCRCHNFEFAVLLMNDGSRKSALISTRIKQLLCTLSSESLPPQLNLDCSIGLATTSTGNLGSNIMFARARQNIARQQTSASDQSTITTDFGTDSHDFLHALESALEKNTLNVTYQAIMKLETGSPEYYELRCALTDKGNLHFASQFLDLAIQHVLGEAIDRQVISRAVLDLQSADCPGDLIVNLSQNSLVSRSFIPWLSEKIEHQSVKRSRLILQISEIDLLTTQHHIDSLCRKIQQLGLKLSISHFGSTPNPLRYLSLVTAELVKLDHQLLHDIDGNNGQTSQFHQLVSDIHHRDMLVIAPMIEQPEQLPALWQAGVDLVQGNSLGKPADNMEYRFTHTVKLA